MPRPVDQYSLRLNLPRVQVSITCIKLASLRTAPEHSLRTTPLSVSRAQIKAGNKKHNFQTLFVLQHYSKVICAAADTTIGTEDFSGQSSVQDCKHRKSAAELHKFVFSLLLTFICTLESVSLLNPTTGYSRIWFSRNIHANRIELGSRSRDKQTCEYPVVSVVCREEFRILVFANASTTL